MLSVSLMMRESARVRMALARGGAPKRPHAPGDEHGNQDTYGADHRWSVDLDAVQSCTAVGREKICPRPLPCPFRSDLRYHLPCA